MDAPTHKFSSPAREDAIAVVRRLREAGHVAYFAGGCVRDELLGLTPKDYDVATDAPPDAVRTLFRSTQAVGASFGVILVRINRSQVEVATFRSDGRYEDGRRPTEVRFTTAKEDARRRDFTINGMFLDPVTGDVVDHVGGRADLAARQLRAIGDPDARFAEDHLRLLRAVRFAARFDLKIEDATAAAIARHAGQLKRISPERIAEETRRMLTAPTRAAAWRMLRGLNLAREIFRFLEPPVVAESDANDLFVAVSPPPNADPVEISFPLAIVAASLELLRPTSSAAFVEMLRGSAPRKIARAARQGLKVSNDVEAGVDGILGAALLLLADEEPTVARLKRFLARTTAADTRVLLDALASGGSAVDRIAWLRPRLAELERTDVAPVPLVTGDDLTAAGFTPGPAFKRILERTYDAQLEGRVGTKDDAMALARTL